MALILNEDEEQFRQSVRRLVAERSPLAEERRSGVLLAGLYQQGQ